MLRKALTAGSVLAIVIVLAAAVPAGSAQTDPPVRSVILMIGDGMGMNHVRLAEMYAYEILGRDLAISSIRERSTMTTQPLNGYITNSAAAGTAMLSGQKTTNTMINMLPDETPTYTVSEAAHAAGLAVGVVTTARIMDATPAVMYAHAPDRDPESFIADQLLDFRPEVAMGGGWMAFLPMSEEGSTREDERDLLHDMAGAGYTVVQTADDLAAVDLAETDYLLGLFARASMAYEIDRVNDDDTTQPALADMTRAALQILERDEDGFFLMVEGARIDHASHFADARGMIDEVLAFDDAIRVALDYQAAHPDVLVIVTADHETGGLSLGRTSSYRVNLPSLARITCSMERLHYKFGYMDALKAVNSCGVRLDEDDRARLMEHPADTDVDTIDDVEAGNARSWGHLVVSDAINRDARLSWGTWTHTAAPVIVYVVGPHGDRFEGGLDNTDIATNIAALLGLAFDVP